MKNINFIDFLTKKDCVFWDWNGTLLQDKDYSLAVTNKFLKSKGLDEISEDFYLDNFTIPVKAYYETLGLNEKGISFEEVSDDFLREYKKNRESLKLYQGAKDCLKSIFNLGVPQVLFSAAHISELEYLIKLHSLEDYFELVSGADDLIGGCKLERGKFLKKEYGFSNGVLVGDTLHDMEIGKAIGFSTVWVSEGHQSLKRGKSSIDVDYILNRSTGTFLERGTCRILC